MSVGQQVGQAPHLHDMDWQRNGACGPLSSEEAEVFFPVDGGKMGLEQEQAAKKVCRGCTVRADCLTYAIDAGEDHGIWGGATRSERKAERRRRMLARERLAS